MALFGAGGGSDGCPGDDAVLFDGESEPPVNMITATTATITTRSAAADASRMFLRPVDDGSADGIGVRYCVAAGVLICCVGGTGAAAIVRSWCAATVRSCSPADGGAGGARQILGRGVPLFGFLGHAGADDPVHRRRDLR